MAIKPEGIRDMFLVPKKIQQTAEAVWNNLPNFQLLI